MPEQLIKEAKNGNKEAFEKLILYYQQDLYKIARARLNNIEDICDAIQETILSAYKSIKKMKNPSKFKFWLIRVLINKCNDVYRINHKHPDISFDSLDANTLLCYSTDLETNIEFFNLLKNLTVEERTIIILYYMDNYSSKEIAHILKLNNNTVKSKLSRIRKKLEKDLKEVYEYE